MTIVSLMTWNHFPLPGEGIMLLLDCDFLSPSVVSSSPKCQKSSERGNRAHWSHFLRIILSTAFLSFFCYYLYLGRYSFMFIMYYSRTIFFYVYYVLFLSVHLEIGGVIYFTKRGCEVTEKAFRIVSYYLEEHMGKSFGGSVVHCKKRFWTWLLAFPVFERTQCREPKYQIGDMECSTPMPRRLSQIYVIANSYFSFMDQLEFQPHWKVLFLGMTSLPPAVIPLCCSSSVCLSLSQHVLVFILTVKLLAHICH